MRNAILAVTFICLLAAAPCRANKEQESGRALIVRAVRACGLSPDGPLAVHCRFHVTGRVPERFTASGELHAQPDGTTCRLSLTLKFKEENDRVGGGTIWFRDGKGWIGADGETREVAAGEKAALLDEVVHAERAVWLLPLLHDKKFSFAALAETRHKGRAVQGVKVSYPKKSDVLLYFDKETGRLRKGRQTIGIGEDKVKLVREFEDFRAVDGGAADEEFLRQAKIASDGQSLIRLVREQLPTAQTDQAARQHVADLGDKKYAVREAAAKKLEQIGPAAIPILTKGIEAGDLEQTRRCEQILQKIRQQRRTLCWLPSVRLLAWRKPAGALDTVLACLEHSWSEGDRHELQSALAALAFHDGKLAPAIEQALQGPEPLRGHVTAALCKDGGAWAKRPGRRIYVPDLKIARRIVCFGDADTPQEELRGKELFQLQVLDVQLFNRLPDSVFEMPKANANDNP